MGSPTLARAALYYVSPTAGMDNTDHGTAPETPWATLPYAVQHAANGSTIYLLTGDYGDINLDSMGGSRSSWNDALTITSLAGQTPVINSIACRSNTSAYLDFYRLNLTGADRGQDTDLVKLVDLSNSSHIKWRECMITGHWDEADKDLVSGNGICVNGSTSTQSDIAIIDGEITHTGGNNFAVYLGGLLGSGVVVRGMNIHDNCGACVGMHSTPTETGLIENNLLTEHWAQESTHYANVALFSGASNWTVRNNVIRGWGGSGAIREYYNYNWVVYNNNTYQNNLIYESRGVTGSLVFLSVGENMTFCNNTFVGSHGVDPEQYEWNQRHSGTVQFVACTSNGSPASESIFGNLQIHNNIILGLLQWSDAIAAGWSESNNIVFLPYKNGAFGNGVLSPTSRVVYNYAAKAYNSPFSNTYFETPGRFFVGGQDFDQIFRIAPTQTPRDYLVLQPAQGAPSIDAADAAWAPTTDLRGTLRDAQPDIGCFEYGGPAQAGQSTFALVPLGSQTATVGVELAFTVEVTPPTTSLVYSASTLPAGATFTAGDFRWTPGADQVGPYSIRFTVSDGQTEASEVVAITVQRSNTAPVLYPIGDRTVSVNELLSFSLSATDADGDPITFTATDLPNGASLVGPTFTWTPADAQAGTYNVSFVADDGYTQTAQAVTITVTPVDHPPVLAAIGDKAVDESGTLTFDVSATDPDGDALAYAATGLPAGADFTGQTFTWTPGSGQAGTYQVTFVARAGNLSDSETVSIIVAGVAPDTTAPVVAQLSPAADAIQVPLNNLVTLHITDAGTGVDPNSVTITIQGSTVYQGNQDTFTSPYGQCSRSGTRNDYRFIFQDSRMFDFDRALTVRVRAADRAGNAMNEYVYSFITEMRSFSSNKQVSKSTGASNHRGPATAHDAAGNIWAAWQDGSEGARDIYVARLAAGAEVFDAPMRLTNDPRDQCNPDLAIGPDGSVYVVWQDNRSGNWDIYASIGSADKFSREVQVTNSDKNETSPSIAVDGQSPAGVWVAWEDDRDGNLEIYVAGSSNAFASSTAVRVTTEAAPQTQPDILVDAQNTVYIFWTDERNGQADVYGAASSSGPWTNVPVVAGTADQTDPAVAAQPGSSVLHLVWVDSTSGNRDIYYAKLEGLPASPATGSSVIDDTSGAEQVAPAVVCNEAGEVFACWQDFRHAGATGTDSDLYVAELSEGTGRTNVFVGDDGTNANQGEPALGLDAWGQPYLVWSDDRDTAAEIYYAATTFIDPSPLDAENVTPVAGATIGTPPAEINDAQDVSIVVPAQACQSSVRMSISKVVNPQVSPLACLGSYDFGPSGISFDQPVTVTIPYRVSGSGRAKLYWYDSLTGALSQQGITNIENIVVASNLNALRFQTTHFTPFYVVASDTDTTTTNGDFFASSGGCSLSPTGDGSPAQLLVPYALIAAAMIVLRRRDRKRVLQNSSCDRCDAEND